MKKFSLITFLFLASCRFPGPNKVWYQVAWIDMPSEFNYPRIHLVHITAKEVKQYEEGYRKGLNGPVTGPYVADWRGNIVSFPKLDPNYKTEYRVLKPEEQGMFGP